MRPNKSSANRGLAGMTALTMGLGQQRANGHKETEFKKPEDEAARAHEVLNRS